MKNYFGTDGIRGVAGEPPLDARTVFAAGLALGDDLASRHPAPVRVVFGEDTRESSASIAAILAAGLAARGVATVGAGVLPTPGVAFLAHAGDFAAGVMISASHNPYQDNGIKIFGHSGFKLPDEEEAGIEVAITRYLETALAPQSRPVPVDAELRGAYTRHLVDRFRGVDFAGLRIVVDCAHGASSTVAPEIFAALGVAVEAVGAAPDGRNINAGVGALYPEPLAAQVRAAGADAGIALDGDADRAILTDHQGAIVDGDAVLLMAARELSAAGALAPPVVVGTVMTNLGLERALAQLGIQLERTAVGDKYVLERMRALGAVLGGEPSGHVIFGAEATTGDGLLTALHCLDLMARRRQSLAALAQGWTRMPQKIVNVPVRAKMPLEELATVQAAIARAEEEFNGAGRVLVRYSGTEKLARVMVEAASAPDVARHAEAIAQALRSAIGQ
ncbi:MAG TPA: phosphoglucosamine mutase [Terriglobales bacterium]|jgi:phosphoglucosamine mutase